MRGILLCSIGKNTLAVVSNQRSNLVGKRILCNFDSLDCLC